MKITVYVKTLSITQDIYFGQINTKNTENNLTQLFWKIFFESWIY